MLNAIFVMIWIHFAYDTYGITFFFEIFCEIIIQPSELFTTSRYFYDDSKCLSFTEPVRFAMVDLETTKAPFF